MDLTYVNIRKRMNTATGSQSPPDALLIQTPTGNSDEHLNRGLRKFFVSHSKIKWIWAPIFISFWLILYCTLSIPAHHHLPTPLNIKDEINNPHRFIAERAEIYLRKLVELGPRVVGSSANEKDAIKYFWNIFYKLKTQTKDIHEIEADVQIASGSYILWNMINMYQSIQNFIIKLGPKNYNGTSYLLVNSHFDSVPGSPGGGDDGAMVSVMLETIRVLSESSGALRNPVIFLFNGAEENPLQASHAFITQHRWAKYVKAVINLDSAGNGGREILFQSGPNHPWLMKHYAKAVAHPYASSIAEEMFQYRLIPSDTDFRIFRDFGKIPGLDMAYQYNGYVYHTQFDRAEIFPRASLQNTGDNVLALVKQIANAPELEDTSSHSEGHTIFFDVLGYFFVFYTETEAIILNVIMCLFAIAACGYSFHMMAQNVGVKLGHILRRFRYIIVVQLFSVVIGAALSFLVAILMDLMKLPLSWFTQSWLIFGLYLCPLFFGLAIVPAIYFHLTKEDRIPIGHRVQLLLHSYCLTLTVLTLIATIMKIRSAFILTISILFYTVALLVNVVTKLHNRPLSWLIPHYVCCIPSFIFFAYFFHGFLVAFIPMTGRYGADTNPELIICAIAVGVGMMTGGFVIPSLNLFRKSPTIICSLLGFTLICILVAATPLGFPYRAETNVQRFSILHVRRTLRDINNEVRREEAGYYVWPLDRRTYTVKEMVTNITLAQPVADDCKQEMMCGIPLYTQRSKSARATSLWIPGPEPKINDLPILKVTKENQISKNKLLYDLELTGPDHMGIFIRPLNNSKVIRWSFHQTPLSLEWNPPYFIYFSYGIYGDPLHFWLEVENTVTNITKPTFEIGIGGHYNHHKEMQTEEFRKFQDSFPQYAETTAWPASYETWYF